jgi:hypothetical protein
MPTDLRVGDTVGLVTVTGTFWIPSRYTGRRSDRWVELTCACRRSAPWVTRAHNVTSHGDVLACRPCVLARGGYPTGAAHRNWRGVGALSGSHLCEIRAGARRRNLRLDLTDAELAAQFAAQGGRCAYTGLPLTSAVDSAGRTASAERLTNDRGYEPGGVVFIHKTLNTMRRTLPLARMVAIAEAVARYDGIPRGGAVHWCDEPPPAPALVERLPSRRDPSGRLRAFGAFRCGRCGRDFIAKLENVRSGNTRSCGCYGDAVRGAASRREPERYGPIRATYLRELGRMAAKRGRTIDVSPEYLRDLFLAQQGTCALTGWSLEVRGRRGRASLDRIDSTHGYVAGNLQFVHPAVNQMKHRQSQADFLTWCVLIASHLGRRWTDRRTPPTVAMLTAWAREAGETPSDGPPR